MTTHVVLGSEFQLYLVLNEQDEHNKPVYSPASGKAMGSSFETEASAENL